MATNDNQHEENTAQPTTADVLARIDAAAVALKALVDHGYLAVVGCVGWGYTHEHVLTPAGEMQLDRLWEFQHGRGAA